MLRRFFKDSAIYTFGTILTKGIQVIMLPIYTWYLSTSHYGVMGLFAMFQSFANVTIALEVNQGFGRFYSEEESEKEKTSYSSTAFWFVIFANILFIILILAAEQPLNNKWFGSPPYVYKIAMVAIVFSNIYTFLQNQLRWYLLPKLFTYAAVIFTIISYGITIILMSALGMKVDGVYTGLLIGYIIACIVSFYFAHSRYKFVFEYKKLKEMLSYSLPLVPSGIAVVLLMTINRVAVKDLMSISDIGILEVGYKFAAIIQLVLTGFQTAFAPLIFRSYKEKETPYEIERIFRYFLIMVLSIIAGLALFSKEAVIIFARRPEYYSAYKIVALISLSVLFLMMNIFTPGLIIAKKTKIIALINLFCAAITLGLSYLFIPIWGLMGAAIATLLSSAINFLINIFFSQKNYRIDFKWLRISGAFLLCFVLIILELILEHAGIPILIVELLKICIFCFSVYLLVMTLMGITNFKAALQLIIQFLRSKFILR